MESFRLEFYEPEDLEKIIHANAKKLNITVHPDSASLIARSSRGTPRIANRLSIVFAIFSHVEHSDEISLSIAEKALRELGVDNMGLTEGDRRFSVLLPNNLREDRLVFLHFLLHIGRTRDHWSYSRAISFANWIFSTYTSGTSSSGTSISSYWFRYSSQWETECFFPFLRKIAIIQKRSLRFLCRNLSTSPFNQENRKLTGVLAANDEKENENSMPWDFLVVLLKNRWRSHPRRYRKYIVLLPCYRCKKEKTKGTSQQNLVKPHIFAFVSEYGFRWFLSVRWASRTASRNERERKTFRNLSMK